LATTQCETMCHMSEQSDPITTFYQECADMAGVTMERRLSLDLP
jgi:hypothetical protein